MKRLLGIFVGICIAIHYAYSVLSGNPFGQVWSVVGALAVGLAYAIDFALPCEQNKFTVVTRHRDALSVEVSYPLPKDLAARLAQSYKVGFNEGRTFEASLLKPKIYDGE